MDNKKVSCAQRRKELNTSIIYDKLCGFIEEHHYPPSVRELADMTGIKSTSTVNHYLSVMRQEGVIDYETAKPRTIRILRVLAPAG